MRRCRPGRVAFPLCGALVVPSLLFGAAVTSYLRAEPALSPTYRPVAPGEAIQFALEANLKLVRNWLDEKDCVSATQSVQGLAVLARLGAYQSTEPVWRSKTASLQQACAKLLTATKAKDLPASEKLAVECERIVRDLASVLPKGEQVAEDRFIAFGTTKTWMLLMDGAYVDAKSARTAKELEWLAYLLAEEANVIAYQRTDLRWQQTSLEMRAAALNVVAAAQQNDLSMARTRLKAVYNQCEVCHQGFKRP